MLLSGGAATALAAISVLASATDSGSHSVLVVVDVGWWLIAAIIGLRLGRRAQGNPPIARLLSSARASKSNRYVWCLRLRIANGAGKTDILIHAGDRDIYSQSPMQEVARHHQDFPEAIDQLLAYQTWRDTKAAIIFLFMAQRNAQAIVEQQRYPLHSHPAFIRLGSAAEPMRRVNAVLRALDDERHDGVLPAADCRSAAVAEVGAGTIRNRPGRADAMRR